MISYDKTPTQFPHGLPAQVAPERKLVLLGHDAVPGKRKPWKTSGKILVSSWKSEMQPTAEKSDYISLLVCTRLHEYANSKFKWVESKILITDSRDA